MTFAFMLYAISRTAKEDERFLIARNLGLRLNSLGGTNFRNANLTGARFSKAVLAQVSFRDAKSLARVCWRGAQQLERARLSGSILADPRIRELFVTGQGADGDWQGCDLRDVDLSQADLSAANLKGADLRGALLFGADLRGANLSACNAVGVDFTAAKLSGACLEGWNIDRTTQFRDVECSHVFLFEHANERGVRERRPADPDSDFAPGDFEKLFAEIAETIEILLRHGTDLESLREAIQVAQATHPGLLRLVGLRQAGDDAIATFEVEPDADKGSIERMVRKEYEQRIHALEAKNQSLLAERNEAYFRADAADKHASDMKEIALAGAGRPIQATAIAGEGNHMTQNSDNSRKIQLGDVHGDVNASGQAFNAGDISGGAVAIAGAVNPGDIVTRAAWQREVSELRTHLESLSEIDDALADKIAGVMRRLNQLEVPEDGQPRAAITTQIADALPAEHKQAVGALRKLVDISADHASAVILGIASNPAWQMLASIIS